MGTAPCSFKSSPMVTFPGRGSMTKPSVEFWIASKTLDVSSLITLVDLLDDIAAKPSIIAIGFNTAGSSVVVLDTVDTSAANTIGKKPDGTTILMHFSYVI